MNKSQGVVDRVGREVLADPLPDEERGLVDDIAGVGEGISEIVGLEVDGHKHDMARPGPGSGERVTFGRLCAGTVYFVHTAPGETVKPVGPGIVAGAEEDDLSYGGGPVLDEVIDQPGADDSRGPVRPTKSYAVSIAARTPPKREAPSAALHGNGRNEPARGSTNRRVRGDRVDSCLCWTAVECQRYGLARLRLGPTRPVHVP